MKCIPIAYLSLSVLLIGMGYFSYDNAYSPSAFAFVTQGNTASGQETSNALSPGMQTAVNMVEEKQKEIKERQLTSFESAENAYYQKFTTVHQQPSKVSSSTTKQNQELNLLKTKLVGNLKQALVMITKDRQQAIKTISEQQIKAQQETFQIRLLMLNQVPIIANSEIEINEKLIQLKPILQNGTSGVMDKIKYFSFIWSVQHKRADFAKMTANRNVALDTIWANAAISSENMLVQIIAEREKIASEAGNFVLSKPLQAQDVAISYMQDLKMREDLAKMAAQTKWIDDVISYERNAIAQAMPKDSTLPLSKIFENEKTAEEKMQLEILSARENAIKKVN